MSSLSDDTIMVLLATLITAYIGFSDDGVKTGMVHHEVIYICPVITHLHTRYAGGPQVKFKCPNDVREVVKQL